ncbi:MAG: hypothetical protein A3J52_01290 [Omnitrophica bacterium RIFCSPHIGHO2_02_FULL_49_9]|nr:MAG: hypothetical protein A3J52_01290 [Omnitrophica bacterium RIFCSPHIGHO2_02_FULL_49_9]OGW89696.1 MAG: hypothetical protein A3A73_04945 [Omnitrophica bacterium RIFCSPLOWO2_01_FULL_50_24]
MIVDFHVHAGRSIDTAEGKLTRYLRDMKRFHVSNAVVFPINEKDPGPSYARCNRKIAALIKSHQQFIGCIRLDPNQLDAAFNEIEFARKNGFRFAKFHPVSDRFTARQAAPLFPALDRAGLGAIIHTAHQECSTPATWIPILQKHPNMYFIFAHAGKDQYLETIEIAKQFKNVYLETSTLSFYRSGMVLKGAGPKKVVYASDTPYSHIEVEFTKLRLLLSPAQRRIVFSENAKRILGF